MTSVAPGINRPIKPLVKTASAIAAQQPSIQVSQRRRRLRCRVRSSTSEPPTITADGTANSSPLKRTVDNFFIYDW